MTVPARRLMTALLALLALSCRAGARPLPATEDTGMAGSPSERLRAIARKCARIASCAHPHDAPQWRNPSACVDFWLAREGDPDMGAPSCLSSALTCDDVDACLHPRHPGPSAAFCRAHPGAMTGCEGTRLVSCGADDPEESTVVDCASLGATCGEIAQAGGLSTRACVDPARCPAELTKAWCDGPSAVLSCHDGEIERTACPAGATCQAHTDADGERTAMCETPGHTSCTSPGRTRCDGSRLVACEAHGHFGHEHTTDCAQAGLTCSVSDAGAVCTNASPECQAGHPSCEGSALSFCASGKRVRVDCGELGLGPSEADGRGPDATCRPSTQGAR